MYFRYFVIISPWKRGGGHSFEQTWIAFTQGCFVPSLVEIGPVVLEKKILKFRLCIFTILKLSRFGKGRGPSFEQTWIPFTQGCFVPRLVEIGPVVIEKKMKMWKVYGRTDRQTTDDRWSEKLTSAFSLGELKTQLCSVKHNVGTGLDLC